MKVQKIFTSIMHFFLLSFIHLFLFISETNKRNKMHNMHFNLHTRTWREQNLAASIKINTGGMFGAKIKKNTFSSRSRTLKSFIRNTFNFFFLELF